MKTFISSVFFTLLSISLMAQAPVDLKLNLEKGKVYSVKSTSKQVMQITANGQQINMNVNTSNVLSCKVLRQENEIMDIEFKFDTISQKSSSVMGTIETNSAKQGKEPLEKIMNKLSKTKLIAKISTSGKFIDFVNLSKFKDSIMLVLDSVPATKRDEARKQADGILKESAVKSLIEPIFAYLPEKAVKPDDKWESSYITNINNMSILSANTYTLKAANNKTASISGSTETESMPSNDPSAQMTMNLKGTSTSDGTIDVATGLSLKTTTKTHFEGTMTVNNNGTKMEMPMKADGDSETVMTK
jgi:hypothetical protein